MTRPAPASLRPWLVLAADGAIAGASTWAAMLLRFDGRIPEDWLEPLPALLTILIGCRIIAAIALRLHRWSFRFSGLTDGARVAFGSLSGTASFLTVMYLVRHPGLPRSVVVLELLMSTALMMLVRFSPRLAGAYITDWSGRRKGALRTLILGAGAAGDVVLRTIARSREGAHQVIGFLDDDPAKLALIVGGRPVLGRIEDLPRVVREQGIEQVFIAIPRLAGERVRQILSLCADLQLRFKIQDRATSRLQDLVPADLLEREPVTFERLGDGVALGQRVALVTGAAGSIGGEISAQLLEAGLGTLVMTDLDENGLYLSAERFRRLFPAAHVVVEIADIRDARRIRALFERHRPHEVFHAAAHKHVPLMEAAPCEAAKNNVLGTRNVAEAAHASGAARMIYISTDKAVRPTSVMGATKRVGEQLVRHVAGRSATRFCAVRFGNVLGSAGSVVPLFCDQIAAGGPVRVTHPDVRRYFMTLSEAVALVLHAAYRDYGSLCVLDMGEPIRIVDLARNLITMAGRVPETEIPIVFTGLRPGEKLTEELLTEAEERTHQVHRQILVAEADLPDGDLDRWLRELALAAGAEDVGRVVSLLRERVPSYEPSDGLPAEEPAARQGPSAILRGAAGAARG